MTTDFPSVLFDTGFSRAFPLLSASGQYRARPEDFFVDELPGFALAGHGEHLCLHIEKREQNTVWVAKQLADIAGIKQMDVGYCGIKDRHAVTRQWFSLYVGSRMLDPGLFAVEGCKIREVVQHDRKLRPGMHAGNAFVIRLRNVSGDLCGLEQRWQDIAASGVPNYFGEQRFGREGSNLRRAQEMLGLHPRIWRERKHQFVVSALRSYLFNKVLSDRVAQGDWQILVDGEPLAFASAPLWGRGRPLSHGKLVEREEELLQAYAGFCDKLEHVGLQQERRALVLKPIDTEWLQEQGDIVVRFTLPPGTYATSVLRELLDLENAVRHNP